MRCSRWPRCCCPLLSAAGHRWPLLSAVVDGAARGERRCAAPWLVVVLVVLVVVVVLLPRRGRRRPGHSVRHGPSALRASCLWVCVGLRVSFPKARGKARGSVVCSFGSAWARGLAGRSVFAGGGGLRRAKERGTRKGCRKCSVQNAQCSEERETNKENKATPLPARLWCGCASGKVGVGADGGCGSGWQLLVMVLLLRVLAVLAVQMALLAFLLLPCLWLASVMLRCCWLHCVALWLLHAARLNIS